MFKRTRMLPVVTGSPTLCCNDTASLTVHVSSQSSTACAVSCNSHAECTSYNRNSCHHDSCSCDLYTFIPHVLAVTRKTTNRASAPVIFTLSCRSRLLSWSIASTGTSGFKLVRWDIAWHLHLINPPRPTQPGHPSVGRCNEYWWWLRSQQLGKKQWVLCCSGPCYQDCWLTDPVG